MMHGLFASKFYGFEHFQSTNKTKYKFHFNRHFLYSKLQISIQLFRAL